MQLPGTHYLLQTSLHSCRCLHGRSFCSLQLPFELLVRLRPWRPISTLPIFVSGITSALPLVSTAPRGSTASCVLQVRVPVQARVSWHPGQHVFLRFWGLGFPHAFSSHPWTIMSLPQEKEGSRSIDVIMRVHGGVTRELARRVQGKVGIALTAWVDGPYGGLPGGLDAYGQVLLLAGGSGMNVLPKAGIPNLP
jgi:hypothetical protein